MPKTLSAKTLKLVPAINRNLVYNYIYQVSYRMIALLAVLLPFFLLQSVLDLLAKLKYFMQRKATDFSQLPVILESIVSELNQLKRDDAEWCSQVTACVNKL